jgi:hypothetical protein
VERDAWLLVHPVLKSEPAADVLVQRKQSQLAKALEELGSKDLQVLVLDSEKYPDLGFRPASVVAVGPFPSEDDARKACAPLGFDESACHPRQPGEPR